MLKFSFLICSKGMVRYRNFKLISYDIKSLARVCTVSGYFFFECTESMSIDVDQKSKKYQWQPKAPVSNPIQLTPTL
jgi:hypothetical protein